MSERLTRDFFARTPQVVALELIGCVMVVKHPDHEFHARIDETEAYDGANDPASHAYRGATPRTEIMFGPAGCVYVYKSYGIHWCMNIVTGETGLASAVLLRGAHLVDGPGANDGPSARLGGPGILTRVLGVTGDDNGLDVCREPPGRISFEARKKSDAVRVGRSTRIGISKGQDFLWRFFKD
ncbi:MAG: DNA-3-methyladenine glycosylase [Acidimicrobiales bacterium]